MSDQMTLEMNAFETYLRRQYAGKSRFERRCAERLFESGGKRLRPSMVISAACLGEYDRARVFPAAAAMELIHTASLVHDDIVDHADTRRGVPTVSREHGDAVAVYMGDYMLSQSLLALVEAGSPAAPMKRIARNIRSMCAGEIEQYFARYSVPTVAQYLKRVIRKTALLFAASCALGGHCAGLSEKDIKALARFGLSFGVAFQIRDDLLDLQYGIEDTGKPALRDISEGIVTLPVLLAKETDPGIAVLIEDIFQNKKEPAALSDAVRKAGGFARAEALMGRYMEKCRAEIARMPNVPARERFAAFLAALL